MGGVSLVMKSGDRIANSYQIHTQHSLLWLKPLHPILDNHRMDTRLALSNNACESNCSAH